jgi:integrase
MLKQVEGVNLQADIGLVVERYLREKFSTSLTTKKSKKRYEVVVLRFQEFLRKHPVMHVSDISREIVFDYLSTRNDIIAAKTWNVERGVLYNFFKFCLDNDWILSNPVAKIKPKKVTPPVVTHLNSEEAQQLLSYIKNNSGKVPYYEIIATILYTGMRVNEAVHLTKEDVLLDKNLIVIQQKILRGELWTPKTKNMRFVPIPVVLRPIIEKQLKTKGELLFANTKNGLIRDRVILERIKKSCVKAGLKVVHTHSLRHTFCSVSSEKGIPELFIQAVLGHKSADMTARYRHLRPEFLGEQFKGFDYGKESENKN